MRKIALLIAALLAASAFGRVGPVSQYGQLMAGKNSSNKGQIYGSCKGVSDGNEVAVQGMSLFWSISSDVGSPFWTADIVNGLVQNQNIQIVRAPMGVDEDWGSGNYFSKEGYYQGLMNTVVQAAIDNDIYVIVDYHSHKASDNLDNARKFFGYMAQKWGGYDNVIFEVFNEPTTQSWGTIKNYADSVVKTIRQFSDNLILVGSRSWDQYPSDAIGNEVSDPKKNVAYTFHFYAGSHSTGNEGANAVRAMNSGLSVFVSEWGTADASGGGKGTAERFFDQRAGQKQLYAPAARDGKRRHDRRQSGQRPQQHAVLPLCADLGEKHAVRVHLHIEVTAVRKRLKEHLKATVFIHRVVAVFADRTRRGFVAFQPAVHAFLPDKAKLKTAFRAEGNDCFPLKAVDLSHRDGVPVRFCLKREGLIGPHALFMASFR